MFRVKICGITRPEDAALVAQTAADAVGLNFYPLSSRCIDEKVVGSIRDTLLSQGPQLARVGVFVNQPTDEIVRQVAGARLDWVQLHGDESPEQMLAVAEQASVKVLKAFRFGRAGLQPVLDYLQRCDQLGCPPEAILLDAAQAGMYGGTGQRIDWKRLASCLPQLPDRLPWILAGGLNAENVAQAVRSLQPHGVDTASGVEAGKGRKDPAKTIRFARIAHQALSGRRDG